MMLVVTVGTSVNVCGRQWVCNSQLRCVCRWALRQTAGGVGTAACTALGGCTIGDPPHHTQIMLPCLAYRSVYKSCCYTHHLAHTLSDLMILSSTIGLPVTLLQCSDAAALLPCASQPDTTLCVLRRRVHWRHGFDPEGCSCWFRVCEVPSDDAVLLGGTVRRCSAAGWYCQAMQCCWVVLSGYLSDVVSCLYTVSLLFLAVRALP